MGRATVRIVTLFLGLLDPPLRIAYLLRATLLL